MKTRRICAGTLYREGRLVELGRLSWRKVLTIHWRGIEEWCQPFQCETETQLVLLVAARLRMAGLALVRVEIGERSAESGDYQRIWCEVARLYRPHDRAVRVNRMRQEWQQVEG